MTDLTQATATIVLFERILMQNRNIEQRMTELMAPVEQQILMCDDREDLLMMACAMLQRVNEIFTQELGKTGRDMMFRDQIK
jgi:hypothetical protein